MSHDHEEEHTNSQTIKPLVCSIIINAPVEIVWKSIVTKQYYELWAKCFQEGSTFEGEFVQDAKVKFFSATDTEHAMLSTITNCQLYQHICIRHDDWGNALEKYFLKKINDTSSEFILEMECWENYYDMLHQAWLNALQELKNTAESLVK